MVELTQSDERIAELLAETGLKMRIARIIVYLHKAGETESRSIERVTGLRQPEVSMAMKELKELGWVKEREERREGKGRPVKRFRLTRSLKDVVQEMVNQKKKEVKKAQKDLDDLQKITG